MNIAGEPTGKFRGRSRDGAAVGRLDVHDDRWQDAPPRGARLGDYLPKQASDLLVRGGAAPVAGLWRTL
ncbi:hypothetical protein GCM10010515_05280 [Streptomyces fructofermentans]|uniref:Uncharacterized protein n=1 Tax=Streptomyces fructofermentans TaxID=152141 RepID=A0A918K0P5_9ACTN|nr:hypothetical protein GCM10010515_05280 [Streptomyces fructofermentans]